MVGHVFEISWLELIIALFYTFILRFAGKEIFKS